MPNPNRSDVGVPEEEALISQLGSGGQGNASIITNLSANLVQSMNRHNSATIEELRQRGQTESEVEQNTPILPPETAPRVLCLLLSDSSHGQAERNLVAQQAEELAMRRLQATKSAANGPTPSQYS